MKIPEIGSLQMIRTDQQHFGTGKIRPLGGLSGLEIDYKTDAVTSGTEKKSFQSYLIEAVNTVNNQQLDVADIQEKLITDPDSIDVHDVTIAMSKARMSLNLAQTVIDRLVSGWNEITTTR